MRSIQNVATVSLLILAFSIASRAAAEDVVKSGPQTGTELGESFEPLNITGEHAGEKFCLVCDNGLSPVVMIFAREPNDAVMELLRRVDAATVTHHAAGLGSFVVFLSEKEGLDKQLTLAAQKNAFKRLVLSVDAAKGPDGYSVAKEADVTVVLYVNHKVKANHAFRQGQLTSNAIDKIMGDLPKILPAK